MSPNEHGYEADMGRYLYDPEVFSNMSIDLLRCYNKQHTSLLKSNFTLACYAAMTPKQELIKIMKQVDRTILNLILFVQRRRLSNARGVTMELWSLRDTQSNATSTWMT